MTMAATVRNYLDRHGVRYEVVPHSPAGTSSERAELAHVPGGSLAKGVVVEHDEQYSLVVLPATEHVHLGELRHELGEVYALATEDGLGKLFPDCDSGSVPPFGEAYGLDVLIDESLLHHERVYAECGDRAALLRLHGEDFRRLMSGARRGSYAHPEPPATHTGS